MEPGARGRCARVNNPDLGLCFVVATGSHQTDIVFSTTEHPGRSRRCDANPQTGPGRLIDYPSTNLTGCRTHCKTSRQCKGIPSLKDNPQIWTQLQYGMPSRGQCDEMFTSKSPPVYFIMLNIKRPTAWNPPKRSRWTGTAVAVAGTMRYEKSSKKCPCW